MADDRDTNANDPMLGKERKTADILGRFSLWRVKLVPWASCSVFLLIVALTAARSSIAADYPGARWQKFPSPEAAGWSSTKLVEARMIFKSLVSNALIVVHRGRILIEWGDTRQKINVHSVRKSLLSALYGVYVAKGRINIERTLRDVGIDDIEGLSDQERNARIVDLLRARSGVYHPAAHETRGMRRRRPDRGAHKPGEYYYYNNWDFNALGTIFRRLTELSVFEAFEQSIAAPLGMEDYAVSDGKFVTSTTSRHPAYLFRLSARDMARFGLLYLRGGRWRNVQVIPSNWVRESTRLHSTTTHRKGIGYGYLWWMPLPGKRHFRNRLGAGSFSARGNGGQYILVAPALDLIFVHTTDWKRTGQKVSARGFGKLLKSILRAKLDAVQ